MSEKKAKQMRREAAQKKPAFTIELRVFQDLKTEVIGFPGNLPMVLKVFANAQNAITKWFLDKARAGQLNEQGKVTDSNILIPTGPVIIDGHKLN